MWARRDFVVAMPMEEVRSTHQNTLLGNVWHLGNPMLSVGVYYLVFGVILEANRGIDNYILWLMVGVFTFGLTQRTVLGGATSIAANQGLMRAIRFPRALLPVSVVISRLLTFGFELSVLAVVALLTGEGISWRWLVLPAVLARALGAQPRRRVLRRPPQRRVPRRPADHPVRLPAADLRLRRDVPARGVPVERRDARRSCARIINLNPLVVIIEMYRWVFLGTAVELRPPGPGRRWCRSWSCVAGFAYFRGAEHRYGRA